MSRYAQSESAGHQSLNAYSQEEDNAIAPGGLAPHHHKGHSRTRGYQINGDLCRNRSGNETKGAGAGRHPFQSLEITKNPGTRPTQMAGFSMVKSSEASGLGSCVKRLSFFTISSQIDISVVANMSK